jgi:hypothetical protein
MRFHPFPRMRLRAPWRGAALATTLVLAAWAGLLWLWSEPDTNSTKGVVLATLFAPTANVPGTAGERSGASPEAAPLASQARLSPLPETVRHPGTTPDVVARIEQRHAMSRFFSDARDIERARNETTLMTPAAPEAAIAGMGNLSQRQKSDGRAFIRYDPRTLESRVEGDQFDLFLPGAGLTARAIIEQVESVDGMLRWSGRILDFQEGGQFSVTHALGDRYAVGTFNTPVGNFSMEAKNGWGWVASQSSDFFLPPGGDDGLHADHPTAQPGPAGP